MYEGQIVAFCPPTISEQDLGLLMAGSGTAESSAPDSEGEPGSEGEPDTPVPAQEPSSHE
jgi:hypothetical protein